MRHSVVARLLVRAGVLGAASIAALIMAPTSLGQSAVYEGWSYPAGDVSDITPGTGNGWASGSGYAGPLAIVSPTLTHPTALPSSGNALGATPSTPHITTVRALETPLDSTQTLWMSFLARRDSAGATCLVSLQQFSGNRTFSATFGVDVDSSDGRLKYKARWENVGFFVSGDDAFVNRPLSSLGTTDLFLVRIDPADTVGGTQSFDLWVNPNPATLGSPDATIAWPSGARVWGNVAYSLDGAAIDELRIDSSLANVVSIPAPQSGCVLLLVAMCGARRRRQPCRSLRASA